MASSTAKTLMEYFQPAKRLKASPSSSSSSFPAVSVAGGSRGLCSANSPPRVTVTSSVADDSSGLTPEQVARAEFNKFVAKSKRNLAVCSQKVTKAKAEGNCYVPLSELLVEESWLKALPRELHKPYAKTLSDFLEHEIIAEGKSPPIYPPQHLIFNALHTTPFDRVKAVIIGQDPYHGPGQAMGLSFSVPEGEKLPSSLLNIFKELQKDVGCSIPRDGNLQKWAVQGVLLLNAVLTGNVSYRLTTLYICQNPAFLLTTMLATLPSNPVRSKQPNSHAKKGWEQFTDAVIQSISQQKEGVVFLLWGRYAQEKSKLIDASKHHILTAAHPSGLSAHRGFFNCRHFSRTNQLLEQMEIPPIDWQL